MPNLTAAQLTSLKAHVAVNTNTVDFPTPTAINAVPDTGDGNAAIAEWYNRIQAPDFWVWNDRADVLAIYDSIVWKNFTPLDAVPAADTGSPYLNRTMVCQSKQFNIQTILLGRTRIDANKVNVRTGIKDALENVPAGAGGALVDAGWIAVRNNALERLATNAEALFKTAGTGANQGNAATLGYSGAVTGDDVHAARVSL